MFLLGKKVKFLELKIDSFYSMIALAYIIYVPLFTEISCKTADTYLRGAQAL